MYLFSTCRVFTGSEDQENSFGVYGREVDIYVAPNEGALRAGSNKVSNTVVSMAATAAPIEIHVCPNNSRCCDQIWDFSGFVISDCIREGNRISVHLDNYLFDVSVVNGLL